MSRISRGPPISEFLIVGCEHGWLGRTGYACMDSNDAILADNLGLGSFLVRILLYLETLWTFQKSGPVTAGNGAGVLDRTADGDKNE